MKKVLSITTAFAVTLSLAACARRNDIDNDMNRVRYNARRDITRISDRNNINISRYKDGIYTGYGNARGNINEMAIVEIRNGRITDIDLMNVSQQGGTATNPGNTMNNGIRRGTGINNQAGTNYPGTTGTTPGGTNNLTGYGYGPTPNNTVDNGTTGYGTPMGMGYGNNTGTGTAGYNRNRTGAGNNIAAPAPSAANLNGPRDSLIRTMLRDQRYDVNTTSNDVNTVGTINNWKLAVQRALAQARR